MNISIEELKSQLTDPIWEHITDAKGRNIFRIIQSCSKVKTKKNKKKKEA